MIAYVAVYEHGRHECREIDTEKARRMPWGSILYYGYLYGGDVFTSPDAVARYWAKEFPKPGDILPADAIARR